MRSDSAWSNALADKSGNALRIALVLLVLILTSIPYWSAVVPPMTDVAQHILVTYIVREYDNPLLRFRDYFEFGWTGAPTDLFYLVFSGLQSLVGPIVDAKVYLTLWVVALWGSVTWLARA